MDGLYVVIHGFLLAETYPVEDGFGGPHAEFVGPFDILAIDEANQLVRSLEGLPSEHGSRSFDDFVSQTLPKPANGAGRVPGNLCCSVEIAPILEESV